MQIVAHWLFKIICQRLSPTSNGLTRLCFFHCFMPPNCRAVTAYLMFQRSKTKHRTTKNQNLWNEKHSDSTNISPISFIPYPLLDPNRWRKLVDWTALTYLQKLWSKSDLICLNNLPGRHQTNRQTDRQANKRWWKHMNVFRTDNKHKHVSLSWITRQAIDKISARKLLQSYSPLNMAAIE